MKSRSTNSSRSNSIDGQFTSLNNNEMINLRGGEMPTLPPTSGEDYPIDLLKMTASCTYCPAEPLPVL